MVKIKLVAPDGGPRILPAAGNALVEHGGVVEVTPELAGEGPRWRRLIEDDPFHPGNDQQAAHQYREHAGHLEVYDLGTGLLAQVGIWEPTDTPTRSEAKDAD